MRIGELARRTGASVRSLRYYEEQGLVPSDRTSGGHREYLESDVDRVRFVQLLFSAGLPSRAILQILPFLDTGVATPVMRARLDDEHDRIQGRIDELTNARDRLSQLRVAAAESAAGKPASECRLAGNDAIKS
ncbi:MerR family transcriptional regulator [Prauserella rugosa]|uniref:DNA-binding transcriptional MerR regulator n=1 Tax=Prauserella rugosa TaxID=43354 RepID=A0A660CHU9_9PSEU|nr:MerR family transcriptional regulator [Prauserella rugosa]KID28434.1 putative transcriptional regulator [Prauserella sp. Am3]KMS91927.1 MerR family transcriptional regulator [Streptomyces regensis]TWH20611.1 DNA-binding transcriptional MerR regulator [Prauserella rugosa]